jgi:hypothetical protein
MRPINAADTNGKAELTIVATVRDIDLSHICWQAWIANLRADHRGVHIAAVWFPR